MHRSMILVLAGLTLAACENPVQYSGFSMDDFFPLDGAERSWVMENMDVTEDYLLDVAFDGEPERLSDGTDVFTFTAVRRCTEAAPECDAGPEYTMRMSSVPLTGIQIHGYSLGGGEAVDFAAPLVLASGKMVRGDTVTTADVDGHSFTATFVDVEAERDGDGNPTELAPELGCDHTLNVNWQCAHLKVESTPAGHWLAGDWWATPGYNVVAFKRSNDSGKWRTIDVDFVE